MLEYATVFALHKINCLLVPSARDSVDNAVIDVSLELPRVLGRRDGFCRLHQMVSIRYQVVFSGLCPRGSEASSENDSIRTQAGVAG